MTVSPARETEGRLRRAARARPWRRIPRAARWCALVAFLNAAVWSLVTPVFHVPDETSHFAYVQYFAETGHVPNIPDGDGISQDESVAMDALRFNDVAGFPGDLTIWSQAQQEALDAAQASDRPRDTGGGIIETSSQPPLYYALGAVLYKLSPWDGITERVMLIRLLSALLAAATTLFVFLFLREAFAQPWTWTVGALAVAFQPQFGFMSGGVTPDALFFAASAGMFAALARGFRRGLTPGVGAAIGAALAVGFLAKLNFVALIPGAVLALGLLVWRADDRRAALAGAGIAAGMLAATAIGYGILNEVAWGRSWLGGGVEAAARVTVNDVDRPPINLKEQVGYTWQLYFPRLPFMLDQFSYFPPYSTWFRGLIANFGWLDTRWPEWVYRVALGLFAAITALAAAGLWRGRAVLRARWAELLSYLVIIAGMLGAIGFLGIRFVRDTGFAFEQTRYLFPFLCLYAAFIALAALGAGRRYGRAVGAGIVMLAVAHSLLAQMLVVSRFYG